MDRSSANARATSGQRPPRTLAPMTTTRIALWGFTLATLGMAGLAAAPAVAAPGDLDPAFGGGMRLFGAQSSGFDVARAMRVQPDGKVIVAGSDSTGDFLVRRLHADGTPDRGFSADGTAGADFDNRTDTITAIALQDDGKIVAAGKSESGPDARSVIAASPSRESSIRASALTPADASRSAPARCRTSVPSRSCPAAASRWRAPRATRTSG
jgi:hypothetical protein